MEKDGDEDEEGNSAEQRVARSSDAGARPPIYNAEGMHEKLEDICWPSEAAWDESLVITGEDSTQVEDVDDDLARELAFYNQALAAARGAVGKLEAAGTKWLRPPDYYAEMVKSDEHMARVKAQLMHEQGEIEGAQDRRKQREAKKYSKQVQAERIKEKAQTKKASISSISRLRKQRARDGFAGELDMEKELARGPGGKTPMSPGQRIRPVHAGERKVSKKREAKDTKFGFGGRKRLGKQNDASSAADMGGFRQGNFDDGVGRGRGGGRGDGGVRQGGVKKNAGGNRPGKARRQAGNRGR
ncbi:eukaryotic rRNA processing [Coccomyxa subellipsoidea C-169]|uniref:Eukaryotic rRNA processing n=1 Tax=Coccomyxa subellipsoidea (strain C-169) TaxID=574566 RepID=I0YNX6_COCSC|nr:eukaryotic rRNA processing [Coccomyxa subellipsoidea C-169]EIE20095.1 eukaryotic rRNA processing [Coccomyxa subellipsoidea C-169]|eukprot:XP_005644639.1 eukaryotic rRNA processing [Coccomyxa subellipsoidea C-169]